MIHGYSRDMFLFHLFLLQDLIASETPTFFFDKGAELVFVTRQMPDVFEASYLAGRCEFSVRVFWGAFTPKEKLGA